LVLGRQPLGAILHSSDELSQWLSHDDSTTNSVLELLLLNLHQGVYLNCKWSGIQIRIPG